MRIQRVFLVLTAVNSLLLVYLLARVRSVEGGPEASVLRGRGLEIVDDQGRVRASITTHPANTTFKMPDGTTGFPETVILRLITSDGKPRVKLSTSEQGSGLMLLGDSDTTHTILQASGAKTSLKLRNDESTQQVLKP